MPLPYYSCVCEFLESRIHWSTTVAGTIDPDADDQIREAVSLGKITRTRLTDDRRIRIGADVDMYRFNVVSGQRVAFDIDRSEGTLDSYLRVFKSNGRQLKANDNGPAPREAATVESYLEYTFTVGGTYYVGVSGAPNTTYDAVTGDGDVEEASVGSYRLRISPAGPRTQLLPDLIVWQSRSLGFMYDYEIDTVTRPGRTLLRFSTTAANIGRGPMELRGGKPTDNGGQSVYQRIYDDRGEHRDRLAGEFVYHSEHKHIHFADFARYKLRRITADNGVGTRVAGGEKTSFALMDVREYDLALPGAPLKRQYLDDEQIQGISVGWSDVYESDLADQWIDVTDVAPGQYWLEVTVDPSNNLVESDETNNVSRIKIVLSGGGDGDDQIREARPIGAIASTKTVSGHTISNRKDVDMFSFTVSAGQTLSFDIDRPPSRALDSYLRIFDADGNELAAADDGPTPGERPSDESYLVYTFAQGGTYYIGVSGFNNIAYNPLTGRGDDGGSTGSYILRISQA